MGSSDKSSANYGTAVKLHKVSKIENLFANAPSGTEATPNWNIFRCSPPNHLLQDIDGELHYTAKVLERHPFSSQTFIPMGVDKGNENAYVVICGHKDDEAMPITDQVEAFICRGDQAVTYAPGTWHAPMISLVDNLDFAVMIHENGVADEDCQECYYAPGYDVVIGRS